MLNVYDMPMRMVTAPLRFGLIWYWFISPISFKVIILVFGQSFGSASEATPKVT